MNALNTSSRQRLLVAGAIVAACAVGYLIARMTAPAAAPNAPAAEGAAAPTMVKVAESALALMGIATEPVASGELAAEIHAPGTVLPSAAGQAIVNAQGAGTVVQIRRRLGEAVRAGEVLALVESRDAAAVAAELRAAEARAARARLALKREQDLFQQGVTPRQDLEAAEAEAAAGDAEAERARAVARAANLTSDGHTLEVRSPIAGRITATTAALGAFVERNTELFRVADPRFVLVEASITSQDAPRVRTGLAATVTTAAGAQLGARVQSVTPTLNVETRAATVVLTLDTGTPAVLPGEFVQVRLQTGAVGKQGIVVPQDAVQIINGGDAVFVRTAEGFRVQPVTVSARGNGRVRIGSGLNAGDRVATKNVFLLKAELNKNAGGDDE